jgi:DNA-binding IclR family transcriptional regulator
MSDAIGELQRSRRRGGARTSDGSAGSLRRAAPLIRAIAQDGAAGASIADLLDRTNLPRPTVYRVLETLASVGWIERDDATRRYYLAREMIALGAAAAARHPIERLAASVLAQLATEIGQPTYLMLRAGLDGVCVARHESGATVQALVLKVGTRVPMGRGASTLAMMAAMTEAEADEIIACNRARYRAATPAIDEAALRRELDAARQRGFASHDGMFVPGMSGIAVAIRDPSGHPIAGVSTAFVTEWLSERERAVCARRLAETAADIASRFAIARAASPNGLEKRRVDTARALSAT